MMTSSNGNISALLALCAGNSPVTGEFPPQRPVTRSFDVFFELPLNKRLSKQCWGWWFETSLCSLWRHSNYSLDCKIISSCSYLYYAYIWAVVNLLSQGSPVLSQPIRTHSNDVSWASRCLISPGRGLFVHQFFQASDREKFLYYWPFGRGIHWLPVESHHKNPVMWKTFQCHHVIVTHVNIVWWASVCVH